MIILLHIIGNGNNHNRNFGNGGRMRTSGHQFKTQNNQEVYVSVDMRWQGKTKFQL